MVRIAENGAGRAAPPRMGSQTARSRRLNAVNDPATATVTTAASTTA
jgi:hypothetical protein